MDRASWMHVGIVIGCLVILQSCTVESVCCDKALIIKYNVTREPCDAVGGRDSPEGCVIKICADGRGMQSFDNYCGRGPCNFRGCDCEGGCHQGDWEESFIRRSQPYNVVINGQTWVRLSYGGMQVLDDGMYVCKSLLTNLFWRK